MTTASNTNAALMDGNLDDSLFKVCARIPFYSLNCSPTVFYNTKIKLSLAQIKSFATRSRLCRMNCIENRPKWKMSRPRLANSLHLSSK